jgi:hypothetical protein
MGRSGENYAAYADRLAFGPAPNMLAPDEGPKGSSKFIMGWRDPRALQRRSRRGGAEHHVVDRDNTLRRIAFFSAQQARGPIDRDSAPHNVKPP